MSSSDYSSFKVVDLKKELKNRGLSQTGNKDELIERLNTYTQSLLGSGSDIDGFGESMTESDILDEDGVLGEDLDYDEEVLKKSSELDASSLDLPGDVSVDSNNSALNVTIIATDEGKPLPQRQSQSNGQKAEKKVHLIRNRSLLLWSDADIKDCDKGKEDLRNGHSIIDKLSEKPSGVKIPIKSNIVSAEQRQELRKRKFGIVDEDEKKVARAARFGIIDSSIQIKKGNGNLKNHKVDESVDVLKQRAQRFGLTVAPALEKTKTLDALKSRAQRFGAVVSPLLNKLTEEEKKEARKNRFLTNSTSSTSSASIEEKKRLRSQRFNVRP